MTRYEDLDSEFIELNTMLDVRIQGWNITQDKESYVEY